MRSFRRSVTIHDVMRRFRFRSLTALQKAIDAGEFPKHEGSIGVVKIWYEQTLRDFELARKRNMAATLTSKLHEA